MKQWMYVLFVGLLSFSSSAQNTLTPELLWDLDRISNVSLSPDETHLLYALTSYDVSKNKGNTDLFLYNLQSQSISQLTNTPHSEYDAQWLNATTISFLSAESGSMEVYTIAKDGSQKVKISEFGEQGVDGYKFSPTGDHMIVLRSVKVNETIQDRHPDLPFAEARLETDLMYRHWNQWSDENATHLFVHSISNGKVQNDGLDLNKDEKYDAVNPPFSGLEQVTFTPDGKSLIYSAKKLLGKAFAISTNTELYKYDFATGNTICLTEKGYQGYDNQPSYSVNGDLAWLSMAKNGFESDKNDLVIARKNGSAPVNVTSKYDLSLMDYTWSKDGKKVYFIAASMGTKQLFELDLIGDKLTQLTKGMFDIASVVAGSKNVYLFRQSMIEPGDIFSLSIEKQKGKQKPVLQRLTEVNADIWSRIDKPEVKEWWVKTSDGKDMLVWMVLPPNFDPNKKYPSLMYCQGGPQSPVSQFFSYRWNFMLMASQGYVVVAPNRRGLPGFGQQWNDAISKDWGGQAIQDYLVAADSAKQLSYVDDDRMGAIGASYGGYSVYYLAGVHENRFKTFVSHCGLFNLESWYGTTEELFFANWDIGGPYWKQENFKLYSENSPHKKVANWNTPILVIHGGKDFRVPESEGMQAFQAAQLLGLKSKYLYFPNEGHWVLKPQNGLVWHREFFNWLDEDLKP